MSFRKSHDTPQGSPRQTQRTAHAVQRQKSGETPKDMQKEQVLKFCIGLALLGEKKHRFLLYMQSLLKQTSDENQREIKHDI